MTRAKLLVTICQIEWSRSLEYAATLYGKLQQAVRMLGGEQKDALTITESISQALRLSGASATEAQSSLLQFGHPSSSVHGASMLISLGFILKRAPTRG